MLTQRRYRTGDPGPKLWPEMVRQGKRSRGIFPLLTMATVIAETAEGDMACCRICGTENGVKYRSRSFMALCESCHADTPEKVGFTEFCVGYLDTVPAHMSGADRKIAYDFFDDYKCSRHGSVADYRAATTEAA